MAALAGKGQKAHMAACFALNEGKAVVQVAAFQIPVNDLLDIGPPESVLGFIEPSPSPKGRCARHPA